MYRRIGALMLALVVSGAPAALTACEIVCAARDGGAFADGSGSSAHSCHGTRPSEGPLIGGGVHICGHEENLPAAAAQVTPPSAPAVPAVVLPSPVLVAGNVRVHAAVSSPHGQSKLPIPLRI